MEEALSLSEPNLVTLKCLNDELSDLNRFYTEQSSYLKWGPPNFVISTSEMTDLRERLLTKMDVAQSLRSQLEDEHRQLNKNFLESKSLPKISVKTWQLESPNFRNSEARINALRNSVTSELDRQAVDSAQSESKIMDYLFFKYGTRLVVSSKMLEELESCKPPTSESLETFLVNVVVTCEFVMRENQTSLVTPQRLIRSSRIILSKLSA